MSSLQLHYLRLWDGEVNLLLSVSVPLNHLLLGSCWQVTHLLSPPLKTLTSPFMIGLQQSSTVPLSWLNGELLGRRQLSALTVLTSRNPCADADALLEQMLMHSWPQSKPVHFYPAIKVKREQLWAEGERERALFSAAGLYVRLGKPGKCTLKVHSSSWCV